MHMLARPSAMFDRRARALEKHWPGTCSGDVEGIHQARVASRRLREVLPLLAVAGDGEAFRSLERDMKAVTRALGPVRELDVALAHLDDLRRDVPAHAVAIDLVRQRVQRQRDALFERIGRPLGEVDARRIRRRIREAAAELDDLAAVGRCAVRVADRLSDRRQAVNAAILSAGVVYAAGPLHDLRIALKKHRYALEIATELLRSRSRAALTRSKRLQDLLGDVHDMSVLAARVLDVRAATPRRPASTLLQQLADHLDGGLRALHAEYLDARGDVVAVLERSARIDAAVRASAAAQSVAPVLDSTAGSVSRT